jgi:hypothetical protein
MNNILLIIGVGGVLIIAVIVTYQFIQQQTDRQVMMDLVNKQINEEEQKKEFITNYEAYLLEAATKCDFYLSLENRTELLALQLKQVKCNEDLLKKYGLMDSKYDEVTEK